MRVVWRVSHVERAGPDSEEREEEPTLEGSHMSGGSNPRGRQWRDVWGPGPEATPDYICVVKLKHLCSNINITTLGESHMSGGRGPRRARI